MPWDDPARQPAAGEPGDALGHGLGSDPAEQAAKSHVGADEAELAVRSTALNLVALMLTVGAAGFLVLWSGRRLVARRRRS